MDWERDWEKAGRVPPKELSGARQTLHWAAQLPAAVGVALVPPQPDDSHTALECLPERSWLLGGVTKPSGRRAGLSLPDLRLVVAGEAGAAEENALRLEGKTLRSGLDWLGTAFDTELTLPDYDMPSHPLADGAPFERERPETFDELALWFRNAARVLESLDWGPVRSWPHHFDIAVLRSLGEDKSIGVGLSPGDGSYDEPYWYVSPWPYPSKERERPALEHGHWHEEGFFAAILTGSGISDAGDEKAQAERLATFLDAAIRGAEQLVGSA